MSCDGVYETPDAIAGVADGPRVDPLFQRVRTDGAQQAVLATLAPQEPNSGAAPVDPHEAAGAKQRIGPALRRIRP